MGSFATARVIDFDYPATFAGKLAQPLHGEIYASFARQPDCQFPALPRYNVEQSSSASPPGWSLF